MRHRAFLRDAVRGAAILAVLSICASCAVQGAPSMGGQGAQGSGIAGDVPLTHLADLPPVDLPPGESLRVVGTSNIVADVLTNIGGESIQLTALIPRGADPHTFQPLPSDYRILSQAHVVFINGVGLEEPLQQMLQQVTTQVPIVSLSEGIQLIEFGAGASALGTPGGGQASGEHASGFDPHVWLDPDNVMIWAQNAAQALSALDPANAGRYQENARLYVEQLQALDVWITSQVSVIPQQNRQMVTDHLAWGYFARRYGFSQVGAIIPSYSTAAETSAGGLASLEDAMRSLGVKAIFVSVTLSSTLAQRVAEDTAVKLVPLYVGALGEEGGEAATYLELMRYDVGKIVEALK
jgi:ABC-type Zn uptake system ZnuABC Zn-binding protein ZnuA